MDNDGFKQRLVVLYILVKDGSEVDGAREGEQQWLGKSNN